jgi:hypothetical protein
MAIPEVFAAEHANPKTKTEAETVWLTKFVAEVNKAVDEGRKPFVEVAKIVDTDALTFADFIDKHYLPCYYQAETIDDIKSPDAYSKVTLLRRDLGDLRLKQLESEVVVDDYKKRLLKKAKWRVTGVNRKLSKLRQILYWARDFENGTHVLFGTTLGAYHDGETTLARQVLPALRPGMLCLADRLFFWLGPLARGPRDGRGLGVAH